MSKKQSKSVEKVAAVEKVLFCKDCRNRNNGSKAKREGWQGYCPHIDTFVNRKHEVCDKYKGKPHA